MLFSVCVCVGGKTSMSSQPLHTAKQIGEVVRSHNMKIQPGDEEGWRQGDADLMSLCANSDVWLDRRGWKEICNLMVNS